jgi:hypothetical protein
VREFIKDLRDLNVTPHVAQNTWGRSSAIDAHDTASGFPDYGDYEIGQQKRKRTEEPPCWSKSIGEPTNVPRARACCDQSGLYPQ